MPLDLLPFGFVLLGRLIHRCESGSLRGDYCIRVGRNLIHGSDGGESAQHEIGMWFTEVREKKKRDKAEAGDTSFEAYCRNTVRWRYIYRTIHVREADGMIYMCASRKER